MFWKDGARHEELDGGGNYVRIPFAVVVLIVTLGLGLGWGPTFELLRIEWIREK